jgi:hypothetical protein
MRASNDRKYVDVVESLLLLSTQFRALFVLAFPPARCPLAEWLRFHSPADFDAPGFDPGPNHPLRGAAALREGALLYELDGEPVSKSHVA